MASIKVATPEGRFRFLHIFEAVANYNGDKMEKSLVLLIPKKANLRGLEDAWKSAAIAEFKKIPGSLRKLTSGQKPILKDGDEYYATRDEDKQPMYESYQGNWVFNISNPENRAFRILGPDGVDLSDPAEMYDGCYGSVIVELSAYTPKARPGYSPTPMMSAYILAVKKTRDGEPLESGAAPPLSDEELSKFYGAPTPDEDTL